MDRLYGKLYEDNTFILHGNKSLVTGQLNKNNTIEGVNYCKLTGGVDKLNNKEVSHNNKYISIPILQKTEDNKYIFNMNNVHAQGYIGNKIYSIVHTDEQGNSNILRWVFVNFKDLEYINFEFHTTITYNESFKEYYTSNYQDYIFCNDITIYDDDNDIDKWLYITLDDIGEYTYNFEYLFISNDRLTCYADINKIIICYNNDKKQEFENITNIRDHIYLKCNSDISTITKIYFKLSKSIEPLCNKQCGGEVTETTCNTCNGSGFCDECGGEITEIKCNSCDGSGFCDECEGTPFGCTKCKDTGICIDCNGSGSYEKKCTKCEGTKACINCDGQGYVIVGSEINPDIHQENIIGVASIAIEARENANEDFAVYE